MLSHGYDENKSPENRTIADMRNAAAFRGGSGGKCLSDAINEDIYKKYPGNVRKAIHLKVRHTPSCAADTGARIAVCPLRGDLTMWQNLRPSMRRYGMTATAKTKIISTKWIMTAMFPSVKMPRGYKSGTARRNARRLGKYFGKPKRNFRNILDNLTILCYSE